MLRALHPAIKADVMIIRPEIAVDAAVIRSLTDDAFEGVEHSSQTEGTIVDSLRQAGALSVSLVAVQGDAIVGHVAFSPVLIDGNDLAWFGLGPVSVSPALQRQGIGSSLIREGLKLLQGKGASGCVVLGDPDYYRRFGFSSDHALRYGNVPPEYFQSLRMSGPEIKGAVVYHDGFEAR